MLRRASICYVRVGEGPSRRLRCVRSRIKLASRIGACACSSTEVRRARQKYARAKVVFDQEVVDAVAQTAAEMMPEVSARHEALSRCLQKLHARDRELVLTRYEPGSGVEEAAQRSGRSLEAAYKALGRIRKLLHDCVSNQLSLEGAA